MDKLLSREKKNLTPLHCGKPALRSPEGSCPSEEKKKSCRSRRKRGGGCKKDQNAFG